MVSAANREDFMQAQLIAGRYQVLHAIGRGGMGTVWLCRDEVLGRRVAVKQIGALPGESATEAKRAMREARSAASVNHPNAVAVYDVVDHDGHGVCRGRNPRRRDLARMTALAPAGRRAWRPACRSPGPRP